MYEWVNERMDELMDEAEKSSGTLRQKLLQIKINMEIKIQIQKRAGGFLRNPQGSWGAGVSSSSSLGLEHPGRSSLRSFSSGCSRRE